MILMECAAFQCGAQVEMCYAWYNYCVTPVIPGEQTPDKPYKRYGKRIIKYHRVISGGMSLSYIEKNKFTFGEYLNHIQRITLS